MDSSLIRFVAAGCRNGLDGYTQYVDNVSRCLQSNGMVDSMLSEPACTKKVTQLPYSEGRRISYEIVYSSSICGISYTWYINMDFFEKKAGIELRINITSQTYMMSIGDEYLTKLGQLVEKSIGGDWKVFVRVIDAYSDMLNMLLLPEMHRTENIARRVVAGLMTSMYGAVWWKDNSLDGELSGDKCCEKDDMYGEGIGDDMYAVSDNTVIQMNLGVFDKIIAAEWDTLFSQYFSEEFLCNIHKLAEEYRMVLGNHRSGTDFYISAKETVERANRELVDVLWKVEQAV